MAFSTLILATRGIALVLHPTAVLLLLYTLYKSARNFQRSRSMWFWMLSLFGIVCLMVTSLHEISFIGTYLDGFKYFGWTPLNTLSGDITVRFGVAAITSVRLWRLRLISPSSQRRAIPLLGAAAVLLMMVSLGITANCRLVEIKYYNVRRTAAMNAEIAQAREPEILASFVCFLLVQIINIASDVSFTRIIVQSAETSTGTSVQLTRAQAIGPYVPTLVVDVAFLVAMVLNMTLEITTDSWRIAQFMYLTLMRFTPSLETAVFFHHTVPLSQSILRRRAPSGTGRSTGTESSTGGQLATMNASRKSTAAMSRSMASMGSRDELAEKPAMGFVSWVQKTFAPGGGATASTIKTGLASESTAGMVRASRSEVMGPPAK